MEKEKSIYEMELHDIWSVPKMSLDITRVPGGWIYRLPIDKRNGDTFAAVFVPLNNEFMPTVEYDPNNFKG